MFSRILNRTSRLETVLAAISLAIAVGLPSTVWILVIVFTLLYTFGVNLHASAVTSKGWVVIGLVGGACAVLYLVAVAFLIRCWYKRVYLVTRKPARKWLASYSL